FFVVAHLHYVLIGGAVFPLIGAVYYWFPKLTGRLMSEKIGHWNFWLAFVGFNLTFFPMHILGLAGMPRRGCNYLPELWPLIAAIAVTIFFIGTIFTPWAVVWGTPPIGIALVGWFWPKGTREDEQ